jgi:hypothetical protein
LSILNKNNLAQAFEDRTNQRDAEQIEKRWTHYRPCGGSEKVLEEGLTTIAATLPRIVTA